MFELITIFVFIWLAGKAIGLAFKLSWGMAKLVASLLIALAFPALFACILFLGGIALLVPLIMVVVAVGILKACLE